jgi:copper chaperone CopZ
MACHCRSISLPLGRKDSAQFATRAFTGLSLIGGLLSSSCCVIQLLLNSLQLGCAGFAVLIPWQPHFRTLTLLALAHLVYREGLSRRSLLTVVATVALMFSQDVVRFHNLRTGLRPPVQPRGAQPDTVAGDAQASPLEQMGQTEHAAAADPVSNPQSTPPSIETASDASRLVASPALHDTHVLDQDAARHREAGPRQGPRVPETPSPAVKAGAAGGGAASETSAGRGARSFAASASSAPVADDGARVYMRFQVVGIKCEGCAARLKAAVLRLGGVQRCAVDFASGHVLVWAAPGTVTVAEVRGAIQFTDLSYKATLVEISGQ